MFVFLLCIVSDRVDRGNWSEQNTGKLCEIWVDQITKGNFVNGVMNKTGMREVIGRYYFATNLVHDRI